MEKLTEKEKDWKYLLEKTWPAVTTFYEPKNKMSEKLKENLYYLGLVYSDKKDV